MKKIKTDEIYQLISLGDKLVRKNLLKDAFHQYMESRSIAVDYNRSLISDCEEKVISVQNIVSNILTDKLKSTIQKIERLFLVEQFTDIEPIVKEFINFLKAFKWMQSKKFFEEFQVFSGLVTLADGYYDNKQYKQALVMYTLCKEVSKRLGLGPKSVRLIEAFMRSEMICNVKITIAEMYRLVECARELMDSSQKQEALTLLSEANGLESEIPIKFRDEKQLKDLHSKINQLREDSYK